MVMAGLIPAHAGKTPKMATHPPLHTAHPRSRGENSSWIPKKFPSKGSSPLTRGKRHALRPRLRDRGLIPAHAGKTRLWSGGTRTWPAHPRSRGENLLHDRVSAAGGGSSPLTRGKRAVLRLHAVRVWLIPAHAGKTPEAARR